MQTADKLQLINYSTHYSLLTVGSGGCRLLSADYCRLPTNLSDYTAECATPKLSTTPYYRLKPARQVVIQCIKSYFDGSIFGVPVIF